MSTVAGLSLIVAIFLAGVTVLAVLFFGKAKVKTFSRIATTKPDRGSKLPAVVVALLGLALVFVSLTGLVPVLPTIGIGAVMAWGGLGMLMPGKSSNSTGDGRIFLVVASIKLVLSLACLGAAIALGYQIGPGDRESMVVLALPLLFLGWGWVGFAAAAFVDYLRYVERRPLPNVEPEPAVLAKLLTTAPFEAGKSPGPSAKPIPPPGAALPGLLAGAVCVSAGMWFRTTEAVTTEVGYIVGVPLFVYGLIRSGLSLIAVARSVRAHRI